MSNTLNKTMQIHERIYFYDDYRELKSKKLNKYNIIHNIHH